MVLCGAGQDPKANNGAGVECRKIYWYFTVKYAGARCSKTQAGGEVAHCGAGGPGGVWRLRWACGVGLAAEVLRAGLSGGEPLVGGIARRTLEVEQKTICFRQEDRKGSDKRLCEATSRSHIPRRVAGIIWQQVVWSPGLLRGCWLPTLTCYFFQSRTFWWQILYFYMTTQTLLTSYFADYRLHESQSSTFFN